MPAAGLTKILKPQPTLVNLGLLLMRVTFGGLMCYGHGWDKINQFGSDPSKFPLDPLGMGAKMAFYGAAGAEFGCALLIALGLMTRVACLPLMFAMGVAFFKVHGGSLGFVPNTGASEPALIYLAAFTLIMLMGPGTISIDAALFSSKKTPEAK